MRAPWDRKRVMVDDGMVLEEHLHKAFPCSSVPALSLRSIAPFRIYIQNSS